MEDQRATNQNVVEYLSPLKKLFDEDSSNDSYSLPFNSLTKMEWQPEDLNSYFMELEEKNLNLIQQWQENEQQIEQKRQLNRRITNEKTKEIDSLKTSVNENVMHRALITEEKNVLEIANSGGNENLMSESVYNNVVEKISDIRQLVDKKRAKNANQPEPTQ